MLDYFKKQEDFYFILLINHLSINVINHANRFKNIKSCQLLQKNTFDIFQAPTYDKKVEKKEIISI